ncbi:hypothetical protein [Dictyobacter kobayashii]|uniref:hypothetical protein n=1 Tax=Dictyobacter kobayashii TaxID=2014872 RepID=UPI000F823945|nr:hypothetical protein [Dictyobacter kobayashii]
MQLARAGVSGGSAWDLDDAMHNKVWGMWNILKDTPPRPWFYSWSLLCKYFPSNATIYRPANPSNMRVLAAHLPGTDGQDSAHWSVLLVNRNDRATNIALSLRLTRSNRARLRCTRIVRSSVKLAVNWLSNPLL